MALVVQKFGGSSLGDLNCLRRVAKIITDRRALGDDVIAVVSAMHGETDRLIDLAHGVVTEPNSREYDALVASGEQVSAALLSMLLLQMCCPARSYTGHQVQIKTNSHHKKARIMDIHTHNLRADLDEGRVPIVAGFQGVDERGQITTFGRGGSDITAVAIAAALGADECQIYTDVEGVYTSDPQVVHDARRLAKITFEEMLELSSLGAKVLQRRAVEFAGKYNVPVRVLSSFKQGPGTLITFEEDLLEQPLVSGIAFDANQAKLTIQGVANRPTLASHVLDAVSQANIEVDMIVQNVPNKNPIVDFSFTVHRDDYKSAYALSQKISDELSAQDIVGDDKMAKLSIVGVGMRSHAGVASKMLRALHHEGIPIHLISASEIKISVLIDEKYLELGARTLHTAFELNTGSKQ